MIHDKAIFMFKYPMSADVWLLGERGKNDTFIRRFRCDDIYYRGRLLSEAKDHTVIYKDVTEFFRLWDAS